MSQSVEVFFMLFADRALQVKYEKAPTEQANVFARPSGYSGYMAEFFKRQISSSTERNYLWSDTFRTLFVNL